jgi:hypothetical protein
MVKVRCSGRRGCRGRRTGRSTAIAATQVNDGVGVIWTCVKEFKRKDFPLPVLSTTV